MTSDPYPVDDVDVAVDGRLVVSDDGGVSDVERLHTNNVLAFVWFMTSK